MIETFDADFQSKWFKKNAERVLHMHRINTAVRLMTLEPIQQIVADELAQTTMLDGTGDVLEVGCGTGFFPHYAAPESLRPRLVGIDISEPSLELARAQDPAGRFYAMDANDVQFADGSFRGVIGYSSFDSLPRLLGPFAHMVRVTHKGDPIVLFQDVAVDLYSGFGLKTPRESVSLYHASLVTSCKQAGIQIDFEGVVEQVQLLPRREFIARVDRKYHPEPDPQDVLVELLDGGLYACADLALLEDFCTTCNVSENILEQVSPDHVIQIVRMNVVRGRL